MKRLEEQGVEFVMMAEEELKEFQTMIDAFHEHTAIMAIIEYFNKVAVQNAITKESIE